VGATRSRVSFLFLVFAGGNGARVEEKPRVNSKGRIKEKRARIAGNRARIGNA